MSKLHLSEALHLVNIEPTKAQALEYIDLLACRGMIPYSMKDDLREAVEKRFEEREMPWCSHCRSYHVKPRNEAEWRTLQCFKPKWNSK